MDISEVRRMLAVTFPWPRKSAESEEPIRAELFSADRLEQYAESLTASLPVSEEPGPTYDLAARAGRNGRILLDCYGAIAEAARERRAITPAAEWVLDNFHVIDEQLKSIRRDYTPRFASPLPVLADGPLRGYPRVYALMWAFVAHTDSRLDVSVLRRFVQAAQRSRVLTIRELWALPLVLRCVLIENLTRLAQRIVESQLGRRQADELADELQSSPAGEIDLESALRHATEHSRARAFAVQLVQRLRYRDPNLPPALEGLAERLATQGITWDRLIQLEHSSQAAANVTVRNLVTSMRAMSASDWQVFFEEVSLVDTCLRESPAFSGMDYLTRDRYRHAIEELAAGSGRSELEVARAILDKTLSPVVSEPVDHGAPRLRDPGYYLISSGRTQFEEEIGYRLTARNVLLRWYVAHATVTYLGSVAALTALLLGALLGASAAAGVSALGALVLGLTALIPASEIALAVINRWVPRTLGPRHLPRLDLASGLPPSLRTFVAVPTLLISDAGARQIVQQLEVHYLANPVGDVRFALLSDWGDADTETVAGDERLLAILTEGIAGLNRRYGPVPEGGTRFFVFHRRRQWSETQRKWMGWERKRGKLSEFNRLLRGAQDTSFMPIGDAPLDVPSGVRYVITLDADTRLPLGAVRQLVGTAAHPLNAPRFDPQLGRVVEGYGILQPRVTPRLPSAHESSIFQRLFSAPSGVDLYAAAISDVYQDLFGEGSYTGKGLYDVDAFEAALNGRIQEEAVLSHDLLEGVFARCALVSDIELFEDFPSHSEVSAARAHRWARGDWQLLPWLLGRASAGISTVGRWKLIDNLRRSLFPLTVLLTLIASWSIPQAPVVLWLIAMVIAVSFPMLLALATNLLPPRTGVSKQHHFRMVMDDAVRTLGYAMVGLTLLAQQAWLMFDAIVRTLWRLTVTHRNLLEWTTAAQVQSRTGLSLGHFLWPLRSAALVAIFASVCVLYLNPDQFWFALPLILLWWASPLVARAISLPPEAAAVPPLAATEATRLRLIARRTWRFFTTFVTAQDHWLPPDNYQEDPKPAVAHRTSPTNFGLGLLAIVSARDFGWIGVQDMADRLDRTLDTLLALPRYRGHFFNWYETTGPRALDPQYISSVDSGNLAGHLLALEQACLEITAAPVFSARDLTGVRDGVLLMREALDAASDERRTLTVDRGQVHAALEEVDSLLAFQPASAGEWVVLWRKLEAASQTLLDIVQTFAGERAEAFESEVLAWAAAIHDDVSAHARDVKLLAVDLLAKTGTEAADARAPFALPALGELAACYAQPGGPAAGADAENAARTCSALLAKLAHIASVSRQLFNEMDFRFLFDPRRKLFSVGYRVAEGALDESFYDLLASEARLTSFLSIAKGEVPVAHWFKLGRPMLPVDDGAMLLSWSGSMFEYLMPSLVMYTPSNSLLDGTCKLAVKHQIEYGVERGVPWGVSESAFSVRDRGLVYQYSAFGVPGLGFKRGLRQDIVIAPYATALAAMYEKREAVENFDRLQAAGGRGIYGFYEALDYTPSRLPENKKVSVVRAHFAHHQGMSLVALTNALLDDVMRQRFHRHPMIQAADLLLQERTPREIVPSQIPMQESQPLRVVELVAPASRRFHSAHLPRPCAHLLSNGRYTVMVTAAGSGYSTCDDLAVTRWREDPACDSWGSFIFLRDAASGEVWSAGYQPTTTEPDDYDVNFSEERARIHRSDGSIATTLEIMVSPEDDAEVRRLSISNSGARARELEVTSYCEVVLAPQGADVAHPVFSNLFVQTEFVPEARALLAARRPRKATEPTLWAAHVLALPAGSQGHVEYETDRARFLGRNHFIRHPVSVMDGRPLSNTVGAVLDPIFSLRTRVRVEPGATIHLSFSTVVAGSREQIVGLADKYQDPINFARISTMAWTHAQVQLYHLGVNADEANLFQYLADGLIYSDATMRPTSDMLRRGKGSARDLWRHGISGDRPILLLRIDDVDEREIVRQLLRAHDYFRSKFFAVDLVFLNEKSMSYAQDLQLFLEGMVRACQPTPDPRLGGIYVLCAELLSPSEVDLLHTAARVILVSKHGSLSDHVVRLRRRKGRAPHGDWRAGLPRAADRAALPTPSLTFFNGLGGFSEDGREYVTVLSSRQHTPLPWVNVLANELIGFVVSESGAGYSWCINSRENQLTPWSNDPVSDAPGEVVYLRDEDSGELWTPTAGPVRVEQATYIARHGQGYSRFEHLSHRIYSELTVLVAPHDPVKLGILALENRSTSERTLSVTYYVEWALGPSRAQGAPYIVTELDAETGALFAQNAWNAEFAQRVAFIDLAGAQSDWTGDRCHFLGRNGSAQRPAALLLGTPLGKQVGAGLDPCGVLRTSVRLAPGQRVEISFALGQGADHADVRALIKRFRSVDPHTVLVQIKAQWEAILGAIQVSTPDVAMNLLLNRWLLYQALACRTWARAGFYQAGGAYGFRDQLQDSMALTIAEPGLTRMQLLRAAAHQFLEGDVQHWWHPPSGRGVRTHCSDDKLWLPYVAAHYVTVTGDEQIMQEVVPFLEGELVPPDHEDAYFEPVVSKQTGTLFEHCARAIDCSLATGVHGLPLIGTGDWNDGMNRVGREGRGESIWLGWFLYATITRFAQIATGLGDDQRATRWIDHAHQLQQALERDAWDGAWYRRAYFDDGTPLGSASSAECRIDSLAQSWSVISGAGDPQRARRAMQAVEEYLVRPGDDLILLFTPPFDKTALDPGYIKGYLPGVRENGGQYTHAAVWCAIAMAALGEGDSANDLFRMLNPINRTATRAGVHAYKVEPYVVAADIYSEPPHVRRGGWTWYTGAAGWLYRAGTQWILGLAKEGNRLRVNPCIPRDWREYALTYRFGATLYEILVKNPDGVMRGVKHIDVDGVTQDAERGIELVDDGKRRTVHVVLG